MTSLDKIQVKKMCAFIRSLLLAATTLGLLAGCAAVEPAPVEDRHTTGGVAPPGEESADPSSGETRSDLGSDALTGQPASAGDTGTAAVSGDPPRGAISASGSSAAPPPVAPQKKDSPAVVALLNRANAQARSGSRDAAAASLERALKIEPGNAWLWHRLAQLRLAQKRLDDVLALAARSNSRASGDGALMASNWRLIARVHEARGEDAAARAARDRAARLDPKTS